MANINNNIMSINIDNTIQYNVNSNNVNVCLNVIYNDNVWK